MNRIEIAIGDITAQPVEVIVNAANSRLAGGGGVDGAIHRAAGYQQLQDACRSLGGCATGHVKVTPGFNLAAKYIFHAVGPVWHGGQSGESELLASCYRQAMTLAADLNVTSIAFPAISCGVYGHPVELAVPVAIGEVRAALEKNPAIQRVIFCCFDQEMAEAYRRYVDLL